MSKGNRRTTINTNEETGAFFKNEQKTSSLELQDEDSENLLDKEFKNHDKSLQRQCETKRRT